MCDVVLIGAGSSILHLARASSVLGLDLKLWARDSEQFASFVDRFRARYGSDASTFVTPVEYAKPTSADLVVVGSPPFAHEENISTVWQFLCQGSLHPLIFVDKPRYLAHPPPDWRRTVSASHLVFGSLWQTFLADLIAAVAHSPVAEIVCRFEESLRPSQLMHPWKSNFASDWIFDEDLGGGAKSEFCHPLFWLASIMDAIHYPFPRLVKAEQKFVEGVHGFYTQSITWIAESPKMRTKVVQTILPDELTRPASKTVAVRLSDGSKINVDFAVAQNPNYGLDARIAMMKQLIGVCRSPGSQLESQLLRHSDWIDSLIIH